MTVKEVTLDDLVENDYNPRKTFNDAKMEQLKESIENIGILEPLVVRELEDSTYEVIAGTRRFKALQQLEFEEEIPVNVVEADLEQAKLIALSENLEREDMLPTEEAEAFAGYVEVEVPKGVGEQLEDEEGIEVRIEERETPTGGEMNTYYVNFKDYINYLNGGEASNSLTTIKVPSHESKSVQKASNTIPGISPQQIERRITLLILPEALRNDMDNAVLTQEKALTFAQLRELDDFGQMQEEIESIYNSLKEDYDSLDEVKVKEIRKRISDRLESLKTDDSKRHSVISDWIDNANDNRKKLEKAVNSACKNEQLQPIHAIQEFAYEVNGGDIETAFEQLSGNYDSVQYIEKTDSGYGTIDSLDIADLPLIISSETNGSVLQQAENIVEVCEILRDRLSLGMQEDVSEEIAELKEEQRYLEQNLNKIKRESRHRCPHCHAGVNAGTLNDEINTIQEKINSKEEEMESVSVTRGELENIHKDVTTPKSGYRQSLTTLKNEDGIENDTPIFHVEASNGDISTQMNFDVDEIDIVEEDVKSLMSDVVYLKTEEQ